MLFAELFDDLRAGGAPVAENAGEMRFFDQRLGQARRQRGNLSREIAPLEAHRGSGDFPMARRRVLAQRGLDAVAPMADRLDLAEARRLAAGRGRHRAAEAEAIEIGQSERAAPQALAVAAPYSASRRDVAERVGALVAVRSRILRAAATDGIEHDEKRAAHDVPLMPPASLSLLSRRRTYPLLTDRAARIRLDVERRLEE